jgi:cell division protease FtsH
MKFAAATVMGLLLAEKAAAFQPFSPIKTNSYKSSSSSSSSQLYMAVDMPPAAATTTTTEVPTIQRNQYGPTDVRYSDFLKLVNKDKIEKVTFSADGTQLLGVDVDGTRLKIESLPNDPELLTQLTSHKVSIIAQHIALPK